jgi:hypothetical protein
MVVAPAYKIPLSDSDKIALGELCVIQGHIEHLMTLVIVVIASRKVPLGEPFTVSPDWENKMNAMLGVAVQEWIKQIRKAVIDDKIVQVCEDIYHDIETLCDDRNDFVHATYGIWLDLNAPNTVIPMNEDDLVASLPNKGYAAKRTKTGRARPISDLPNVRDKAAEISKRLHSLLEMLHMPDKVSE